MVADRPARLRLALLLLFLAAFAAFMAQPAAAQNTAADFSKGSVALGFDRSACDASREGALRYCSSGKMQVCDGSCWTDWGAGCGDLTNGLVGWWKLDDGSGGTAADSSGSGNDGTLQNGPVWSAGKVGSGALEFDGVDDFIQLGNVLGTSTSFSVAAWIYLDDPTDLPDRIISRFVSGDADWQLYNDYGNAAFYVASSAGGGQGVWSVSSLPSQRWTHVMGVYDAPAGDVHIYIDGQYEDTNPSAPTTAYVSDNNLNIGGRNNQNEYNGRIDDVRVYNRALSAPEVAAIYNAACP